MYRFKMLNLIFLNTKYLLKSSAKIEIVIIANVTKYNSIIAGEVGENQAIALIKLNKPKTFNTLNEDLMTELGKI
jgi:hypothetical protein